MIINAKLLVLGPGSAACPVWPRVTKRAGEKLSSQGLRSGSFIIIISVIVIITIAGFDKLGPDSAPTKHIIKKNNC